jgi:hypothetical protein
MDLWQYLRYRRGDGKEGFWRWELAGDVMSWEQASAPGRLGGKALHSIMGEEPPDEWARPATNLVHWATGVGWGALYGAVASVAPRQSPARAIALGPTAWLSSYAVLPLAKVYEPIWRYDVRTLADDLLAHTVYGVVTSAVFEVIKGVRR